MKSRSLLVFSLLTILTVSCNKAIQPETTSSDLKLAGVEVAVGENDGYGKLFVLNEGKMDANNATLDFLRFTDGKYVTNSFNQMNPQFSLGLGDTGNDLKIAPNGAVWMIINKSNLVEIVTPFDETHLFSISVPQPRKVAFTQLGAYITSWKGKEQTDGMTGTLYRINPMTMTTDATIDLGYTPEGVAAFNGRLCVANSGGLKKDYSYDDRLMIIDEYSFNLVNTIHVAKNINEVIMDNRGVAWVSSLGDYGSLHSGIYPVDIMNGKQLERSEEMADVRVSCMTMNHVKNELYIIGTDDEFVFPTPEDIQYKFYTINTETMKVTVRDFVPGIHPYGFCVNPINEDFYVTDAKDYTNPGTITCLDKHLNVKWSTSTGVNPKHMALCY